MVRVLDAQVAVSPEGNPDAEPIPVAPVVAMVIGFIGVVMQSVGVDEGNPTVLVGVTTCAPDNAETELPQVGELTST